jgi:tetratricopeptide (TPR) repeat protein
MYISIMGLLIIVAWGIKDLINNKRNLKIAAAISAGVVLTSALILSRTQVRYWQNSLTLFEHTLKITENNQLAENSYGCALFDSGQVNEAIFHLSKAVKINPSFIDARNNLGKVFLKEGKLNEAIVCFNEVIKQDENSAEAHYNLGIALDRQKRFDDAVKWFAKTLKMNPKYPDVHYRMGVVLLEAGKTNEAITHLNEALRTGKNQAEIYTNLGIAYTQLGKYDIAIENWTKATELKPDDAALLNNLAWLLATANETTAENAAKAIELAQRACKLTGYNEAVYLDTLGAAYAAAGKFEEAKAMAEKAFSIAMASGQEKTTSEIEKRIKLYEAGQPYREK